MFKFIFRRTKKASRMPSGVYDLNEQDLEGLVGGTPVRHLLYPSSAPRWIRGATNGLASGDAGYSRYTQVFPGSQWQSNMGWVYQDEEHQEINADYYRD